MIARAPGSAVITASTGGGTGTAQVEVKQAVSILAITAASPSLVVGESTEVTVSAKDANGHTVSGASYLWASSNTAVVAVNTSGVVSALAAGSATVSATSDGNSATAQIVVTDPEPFAITIEPEAPRLTALGTALQLSAVVRSSSGSPIDSCDVTWMNHSPLIVSMDSLGKITAKAVGLALISAACNGVADTVGVDVTQLVESITVSPSSVSTEVGATKRLIATVRDAGGNIIDGAVIAWTSSDSTVVAVSSSGTLTALAPGSATVRASSGGKDAATLVNVVHPAPTGTRIPLTIVRLDSSSGIALVSSGIPLPSGLLGAADVNKVTLLINGKEQPLYIEALGRPYNDGSLRSILLQFSVDPAIQPNAELWIGNLRLTPDQTKVPTAAIPAAAALPSDAAYLAATSIVGTTIPVTASPSSPAFFTKYEEAFRTYGDKRWPTEGGVWVHNYYDRALIWYAWWARTGNPEYWRRGTVDALAYRRDYLEANGYQASAHWSQLEGLAIHYLTTGDEQSRYAVGRVGKMFDGHLRELDLTANVEGRVQARTILAYLTAWRIGALSDERDWTAYVEQAVDKTLSTQRADGSYRFRVWCDEQSNYMTGLVNDALIKVYEEFRPDSRIPAAVRRSLDFTWSSQWLPEQRAFKYLSAPCPDAGGDEAAPDLNMFVGTPFGWYYKISGDATYKTRGDEIFQGAIESAWLDGSKQFNQQYYSSFRYLAYRR